jgi:hypothetical protein
MTDFGERWDTTPSGILLDESPTSMLASLAISTRRKGGNGFVSRHMTNNTVNDAMGNLEAFERILQGER